LTKTGAGTLTLSGSNSYTGALNIHDGVIEIATINNESSNGVLGNSTQAIGLGKTNSSNTGTLRYTGGSATSNRKFVLDSQTNGAGVVSVNNASSSLTLSGSISGGGKFEKSGAGTLVLSASNSYTGGTVLSSGVLRLDSIHAAGSGSITQSSGSSTMVFGAGGTYTNSMNLYRVSFANGGNTLSGTITQNNTTYEVNPGETNTLSGYLTGSGGVTLIGGGTLAITGATNIYTGANVISNGTLKVAALADSNTVSSLGVSNSITLAGATTAGARLDYTGGNEATDRAFVLTNAGGTINMATSTTEMMLAGLASGTGTLVVGEGTLVLSNSTISNAFAPASIQVDSGATLQLAADNQIGNSTGLILNGGTFRIGTSTTQFSETLGTLTLSSSSTIDLGSWTGGITPRKLIFANSSVIEWSGTLTITNWQGVALQSGDVAEVLFGVGGLTSTQLGQIYFANQNISGGTILGTGELAPIPEAPVWCGAVAICAAICWRELRRLGRARRRLQSSHDDARRNGAIPLSIRSNYGLCDDQ
jgi:fibronectin-binding autotransporter adhesin